MVPWLLLHMHGMGMGGEAATRIWCRPLFIHRPFENQGVSVYAGAELPLQYSIPRILHPTTLLREDDSFPAGADGIAKTNRIAFVAGEENDTAEAEDVDLSAYAGGDVYVDARHCRDDIENAASHPQRFTLDGDGDDATEIRGQATVVSIVPRAGGVVRITWVYTPSDSGAAPLTFQLVRTAGPSSPSAVTLTARNPVAGTYEFDTAALLDSATYTFRIDAVNSLLSVTTALLTIPNVQADATGPPAVSITSVGAV